MKKIGLALTLLSLSFSFIVAQKETTKRPPVKEVGLPFPALNYDATWQL